jgi:adenosine deaminase
MIAPELAAFIRAMPKVELHVHLEGAIEPETVLALAKQNHVRLPADSVEGLRDWYRFIDFDHFVEVYLTVSACLARLEDVERVARDFLAGQAKQNIRYTEFTYTAWNHYARAGWSFADQLAALNAARYWAAQELGVGSGIVIDIPRIVSAQEGLMVADWAIEGMDRGVVALGLGGPEAGNPPERYADAFERAWEAGLACVPHAGETAGPESVWGALRTAKAQRIGHGLRAIEDHELSDELVRRQIPLEVCPTSNVCLAGIPRIAEHPIERMRKMGLFVTLNSDDPALFGTTLTDEYLACVEAFGWTDHECEELVLRAAEASLLPAAERIDLADTIREECAKLRASVKLKG